MKLLDELKGFAQGWLFFLCFILLGAPGFGLAVLLHRGENYTLYRGYPLKNHEERFVKFHGDKDVALQRCLTLQQHFQVREERSDITYQCKEDTWTLNP